MLRNDLDGIARRLVAPLKPGDALPGGTRLVAITTELALRYTFERDGARTHVEVMPRISGGAARVHTAHFELGHRDAGPGMRAWSEPDALALCSALAERVASNEAGVLAAIAEGDAEDDVVAVASHRALVPADDGASYGLSTYRGCTIGCRFCYAQSRLQPLRALVGRGAARWGSWVEVGRSLPEVLATELATFEMRPIKLCPVVADPYQPIERRERVTRRCIEAIAAAPRAWPTMVLTRSTLVLDDLPIWSSLPRAWVGVSLPTADDAVRRHFEPRAASVAARIDVLRRFAEAGVRTFAVVQPLLPGDVEELADALATTTAGVAIAQLQGEYDAGPLFDTADPACRTAAWQNQRRATLLDALARRGIPVWTGELPQELA